MVINIDPNFASIFVVEGITPVFEEARFRTEFVEEFPNIDLSEVYQITYEPIKGYYHIIDAAQNLTIFASPEEDPRMQYLHSNKDEIYSWFVAKVEADAEARAQAQESAQPE